MPAFAEGAEAKAGLPQLDISLFPAQLFWLAITFVTLYVLMAFVALPGVKRTQDRRHEKLSGDLAAAQAANDAAKAMIAQYEKALTEARATAQATVSQNVAAAAKVAAERGAAQQQELSQRLKQAEEKISAARDEAIKSIGGSAQELAAAIVEKVSGLKNIKVGG